MQYKSILKQSTIFTFCKNLHQRDHNVQSWANPRYIAASKKQLVNFGCKEMQTNSRKFVKSNGLADAVTARMLQLRTFLISEVAEFLNFCSSGLP